MRILGCGKGLNKEYKLAAWVIGENKEHHKHSYIFVKTCEKMG
jgi:hypothetical protein